MFRVGSRAAKLLLGAIVVEQQMLAAFLYRDSRAQIVSAMHFMLHGFWRHAPRLE